MNEKRLLFITFGDFEVYASGWCSEEEIRTLIAESEDLSEYAKYKILYIRHIYMKRVLLAKAKGNYVFDNGWVDAAHDDEDAEEITRFKIDW